MAKTAGKAAGGGGGAGAGGREDAGTGKERADVLLFDRGLAPSREKAQAQILAGLVYAAGSLVDRPGTKLPRDVALEVRGDAIPYVSRGGLKLEKALNVFDVPVAGRVAIDIGASTGGFTDVLLSRGAARVYAVDVGYGQLAWKLRQDPRVVVLERTNARYLTPESLAATVTMTLKAGDRGSDRGDYLGTDRCEGVPLPSLATIDVSFISLDRILPPVQSLLQPPGDIIALIKPQFEAGRGQVGKHGVVRDPSVHREVIKKVVAAASTLGLRAAGLTCSPVTGPEGNIEFLLWLRRAQSEVTETVGTPAIRSQETGLDGVIEATLYEAEIIAARHH